MAEGGRTAEEGSKTISSGSEFVFDFYCELCKDDGKNMEAEGFCIDCGEYLCGFCYRSHPRSRQTRHHELLDKHKMPKDTPLSADRISKAISSKCKHHLGEIIKFYCKTHKVLGCNMCFIEGHRSCSDIESISKTSESIFDSQEFADFSKVLKTLDEQTRNVIEKAKSNVTRTKACYSEIVKAVKRLRNDVNLTLDKLEQDIIAEAKTLVSEEENTMTSISSKCSLMVEEIGTLLADIQSLQSSRKAFQMYISMKESDERIKTLQDDLRAAEEELVVRTFKFEPNRKLKDLIESPNALGKISSEVQEIKARKQVGADKPMLMKATHMSDINVRTTMDVVCTISGSDVVTNNRLIIVDSCNSKVKLLDTKSNCVIWELKVSSRPWDVTVISRNQAAVTLPDSKKILLLKVSDILELDREITVDGKCYGVAYSKNRLIVTCLRPAKLEIMDLSGYVVKMIQNDRDGKQLFRCPQYVCVSNDGDTIYVSDYTRSTVFRLGFDGVQKSKYNDRKLNGSEALCVDNNGNVYVCGAGSRNVHMLTADLIKIQIILTEADGLDSNVFSVSHCQETSRLYIGMENNVKIRVYQLT